MQVSKTLIDLGSQQRRIIEFVWDRRQATVRQVWNHLSPDRRLAYTSILSAMQKLEAAGWLGHSRQGRQYLYRVTRSRTEAQREALEEFVRRVYGGDPAQLAFEVSGTGHGVSGSTPPLRRLVQMRRRVA